MLKWKGSGWERKWDSAVSFRATTGEGNRDFRTKKHRATVNLLKNWKPQAILRRCDTALPLLWNGEKKATWLQPSRCCNFYRTPHGQDGPSCSQKHRCRCPRLSAEVLVLLINISYQDRAFSPCRLCCSLLGGQKLRKRGRALQEVALWAAGFASLAQTPPRRRVPGRGAVFLAKRRTSSSETRSGLVKNLAAPLVSTPLEQEHFGQNPAALKCLPNVPLLFHWSMSLFPVLNYCASCG